MTSLVPEGLLAELVNGEGIGLAAASKHFPPCRSGRPTHPASLSRWITSGVRTPDGRTVRLEACRHAGKWLTSRAAIARFLRAQQPAPSTDQPAPVPSAHQAAVERELRELGI